jgi:hypothetical protein
MDWTVSTRLMCQLVMGLALSTAHILVLLVVRYP